MANNFNYVEKNNLCLGCAACTQLKTEAPIRIKVDSSGFIRPQLSAPLSDKEDLAFARICPGLSVKHEKKNEHWTDLWGPVVESHVGWARDSEVRFAASSGGGITAAACYLLESNSVDAVLHVGVSTENPLTNIYRISVTSEEARNNSGSRYAPAAPLEGLRMAVSKFRKIAVIGKPCDIVAARNLAKEYEDIRDSIAIYISFMCAGVPSFNGTHAVLKQMGANAEGLQSFRYRGNGWPGYATAVQKDGREFTMSYHDSWGKVLNKHLQLRCKVCIDGTGEFADITFADAWYGGDAGYPDFDEHEGRSLVLVRSKEGKELFDKLVSVQSICVEKLDIGEIIKMQPYQAVRKQLMLSRVMAMKLFGLSPPRYDYKDMVKLALSAGLKRNVISFLGMARRAFQIRR